MSVIHQNVRSLGNCIDLLEDILKDNPDCKILCLTEHWKSEEQIKSLGIQNFSLSARFCRNEGEHGGAAIFVHRVIQL